MSKKISDDCRNGYLSVRAANILIDYKIYTKEEFIDYLNKNGINSLRRCGKQTITELVRYFRIPPGNLFCPCCKRPFSKGMKYNDVYKIN